MEASKEAISFADLARLTGITYSQVMRTIGKFPYCKKAIQQTLQNNMLIKKYRLAYVVDASMTGMPFVVLEKVIKGGNTILLLTETIKELDDIHRTCEDHKSKAAKQIMRAAQELPKQIAIVESQDKETTVDDTIIAYCHQNCGRVILLTADRNMALKAKGANVQYEYFQPAVNLAPTAWRNGGKCFIKTISTQEMVIVVRKSAMRKSAVLYQEADKDIQLCKGDHVLVAMLHSRNKNVTMEDYKIIAEDGEATLDSKTTIPLNPKGIKRLPYQYLRDVATDLLTRFDRRYCF